MDPRRDVLAGLSQVERPQQTSEADTLLELPQQWMAHGTVEAGDAPCIIAVESNGELDLRQLHQPFPARRARRTGVNMRIARISLPSICLTIR
jgi:hypothetical protein